jgi:hypothetical protein
LWLPESSWRDWRRTIDDDRAAAITSQIRCRGQTARPAPTITQSTYGPCQLDADTLGRNPTAWNRRP